MRHVQDSTRRHFPRTVRPGRRSPAPPPDELRTLFVEQHIPVPEIAARWGVSIKVIYSRIQEYGLRPDWDAETLRRLYVDEGLSCEEIAPRFGKSPARIYQLLDQYGIPRLRRVSSLLERFPSVDELRRLYVDDLLSLPALAKHFGTTKDQVWNAVQHYGLWAERKAIEPLRCDFPRIGVCVAKDGHRLQSGLELVVDDWLTDHGLSHDYSVRIPGTRYRTDFLVNGTYVEVWGMAGEPGYDRRRTIKLGLYAQLNLPLVSLLPSDFPHLTPLLVLLPECCLDCLHDPPVDRR